MWDLIVSVPDHCLSFYFKTNKAFIFIKTCKEEEEEKKKKKKKKKISTVVHTLKSEYQQEHRTIDDTDRGERIMKYVQDKIRTLSII